MVSAGSNHVLGIGVDLRGPSLLDGRPLAQRRFGRHRAGLLRRTSNRPCHAPGCLKMWDFSTVADHVSAVLGEAEAALRLEQAVYGLDAKDERAIQVLLSEGLVNFYEVAREAHYPSSKGKKKSHRMRCDLVLSPKGRPVKLDTAADTLFDPPNRCEAAEALWLEVKVAYQF